MKKIAFIFPGQGSQFTGMGKKLYDEYPSAKQTFEEANDILGFSMSELCFKGSLVDLNNTENMLLAILTVSVAAFRVYMQEIGIPPSMMAGHSLGEYSALTCSGAVSFTDALRVVRARSAFAQEIADMGIGSMTVINGINRNIIEEECRRVSDEGHIAGIACYNAPDQVVISGHREPVLQVEDRMMEMDAQVTPLLMSPPFHSPLMQAAADKLKEELKKITRNKFEWPVISNVTAVPYSNPERIVNNLVMQLTKPVQWQSTMLYIKDKGIDTVIEMGPQAVLSNLFGSYTKDIKAVSFGQEDDRQVLLSEFSSKKIRSLENLPAKKEQKTSVVTRCLAAAVCTPNRNWDEVEYQTGVIEPCERIEHIQEQLDETGQEPTEEQMIEALDMLRTIFVTKKLPLDKQIERFRRIVAETGKQCLLERFEFCRQ